MELEQSPLGSDYKNRRKTNTNHSVALKHSTSQHEGNKTIIYISDFDNSVLLRLYTYLPIGRYHCFGPRRRRCCRFVRLQQAQLWPWLLCSRLQGQLRLRNNIINVLFNNNQLTISILIFSGPRSLQLRLRRQGRLHLRRYGPQRGSQR